MTNDLKDLLAEAQSAYRSIKSAAEVQQKQVGYGLSWIWSGNLATAEGCLFDASDASDAVRRISATHLYNIQRSGEKLAKAIDWQIAKFRDALGYAMPEAYVESPFISPAHSLDRGRRLSNELFRNAYLCEVIKRSIRNARGLNTVELGAGMGNLARLLLQGGISGRYVIIDIPSTLVFAFLFLRMSFPEKTAVFATSPAQARAALAGSVDLVLIPSVFDEALDGFPYDLFVNTASLGEMPNETIRHWIGFIQERVQPRYALMVNRYLNPVVPQSVETRSNENEASVLFDQRWRVRHWQYDPFYYRCPYACLVARYLEVILERAPADAPEVQDETAMQRSGALFLDVIHEEWLAVANLGKTFIDNTAAHPFTVDTTPTGTLFKLWESIRLHPNLHNVTMMLTYLDFLRDSSVDEFEEVLFYEARLREMLDTFSPSPQISVVSTWLERKAEKRKAIADLHGRFAETDAKPRALFAVIESLG